MDPWADGTLWHLLDWITAENLGSVNDSDLENRLRALAESDLAFARWLKTHSHYDDHLRLANSVEFWKLASQDWLHWLASESLDDVSIASAAPESRWLYALVLTARLACAAKRSKPSVDISPTDVARNLAYDMAYGLSHELNNPLANIATRARLLAEEEPVDRKRKLLSAIVDQAMRGCEMIADLMVVARPPTMTLQKVNLVDLTNEFVERARSWVEVRGLSLQLQLASPTQLVPIETDPIAASEAVWAILRNAIEVSRQQIVIELAIESNPNERRWATIAIIDDGPGLSDDAIARAFHPCYSGREAGRGLGLGLAKADRLVGLCGGRVTLANRLDAPGCRAKLYWPVLLGPNG